MEVNAYVIEYCNTSPTVYPGNQKTKVWAYTAEDALTQFQVTNDSDKVKIIEIYPFALESLLNSTVNGQPFREFVKPVPGMYENMGQL